MCVIILCENEFPSLVMLEKADKTNPHGASIAWIEGDGVRFKKGLNAKGVQEIIDSGISLPAIIHFRIATCGDICDQLCHPFPISKNVSLKTNGFAKSVLFHNGVWDEWQEVALKAVLNKPIRFPDGMVSDSRVMAWLAGNLGESVLSLIATEQNKIATLSKDGIKIYGDGWEKVQDFRCSNSHFDFGNDMDDIHTINYMGMAYEYDYAKDKYIDEQGNEYDTIPRQKYQDDDELRTMTDDELLAESEIDNDDKLWELNRELKHLKKEEDRLQQTLRQKEAMDEIRDLFPVNVTTYPLNVVANDGEEPIDRECSYEEINRQAHEHRRGSKRASQMSQHYERFRKKI